MSLRTASNPSPGIEHEQWWIASFKSLINLTSISENRARVGDYRSLPVPGFALARWPRPSRSVGVEPGGRDRIPPHRDLLRRPPFDQVFAEHLLGGAAVGETSGYDLDG